MCNKKGQSMLEYTVLFCVVLSALLIMQIYIKRSYQGRLKQDVDSLGQSYSPRHTASLMVTNSTVVSVSYTGGQTHSNDSSSPMVQIPDGVPVPDGMTVTFTGSGSSFDRKEQIDSFATE